MPKRTHSPNPQDEMNVETEERDEKGRFTSDDDDNDDVTALDEDDEDVDVDMNRTNRASGEDASESRGNTKSTSGGSKTGGQQKKK
jgi:hypothetical protein